MYRIIVSVVTSLNIGDRTGYRHGFARPFFFLETLWAVFLFTSISLAGGADLPGGLYSPDRGVVCNASRAICYDRLGPSIGLTEAFLGKEAAERLTTMLRQSGPDNGPGGSFSPADGVECLRETGPCMAGGRMHTPLSAVLYEPAQKPLNNTPEQADILGVDWQWQATRYGNDTEAEPKTPARYRLRLEADGRVRITADCNLAGGRYRIDGSRIAIGITHSTTAECEPDSLERAFLRDLAAAAIYFMREGDLYLDLKYDSGTMVFRKADGPER